ncbi:hypothetical protein B7R54_13720 [Subtercola boreus]|uniref:Thioredoxin n=1 Tax=Subtercola boreus TaxID=120213 RepID=A0A3E0VK93_9MICO|nr:thioredoxin [Subtercola boreus]RFA10151.1 hypothetical protein B7R54_13720 [Subtercola boreus]TQL52689.1 hypothetical protein FB464_0172 [Subtercola boreus]
MPADAVGRVNIRLYTSSFCGACSQARVVVDQAAALVGAARVTEVNVAFHPDDAERAAIAATPTIVLENAAGTEVFRAEGVPTLHQVLAALALAV